MTQKLYYAGVASAQLKLLESSLRLSIFAAAAALCAVSLAAHADTVSTFTLENTAFTVGNGTFAGTVTVDVTTGLATAVDLTASGFATGFNGPFTTIQGQNKGFFDPVYAIVLSGAANTGFDLILPTTSLVGYTGSAICTTAGLGNCSHGYNASAYAAGYYQATAGDLLLTSSVTTPPPTPPTAAAPEPASFALLGTGLLGLGGIVRRRWL